MRNLEELNENFEKNKKYLIEILCSFYDKKYTEMIRNRINNVYYDFSSTPDEEYKYLQMHPYEFSQSEKYRIEVYYEDYKKAEKAAEKNYKELIIFEIKRHFKISGLDESKEKDEIFLKEFISIFTNNNKETGLIDTFSTENINLLSNPNTSGNVKKHIRENQDKFIKILKELNIEINNLTPEVVDSFIECRNELKTYYRTDILRSSLYGLHTIKRTRDFFKANIYEDDIAAFVFNKNVCQSITYYTVNRVEVLSHHVIMVPVLQKQNKNAKTIDVSLVHESIHKAETNNHKVGIQIHDQKETNAIMNEIRTQISAIKVAKEAHNNGIYIFDDPFNYREQGECTYEYFFPLIKHFIDEYEEVFTECAITNNPIELIVIFGSKWLELSRSIDRILKNYIAIDEYRIDSPENRIRVKKLIKSMKEFEQRRSTR